MRKGNLHYLERQWERAAAVSSLFYTAVGRADNQNSSPKEISPFNSLPQFIYSGVSQPEKIQRQKFIPLYFRMIWPTFLGHIPMMQ